MKQKTFKGGYSFTHFTGQPEDRVKSIGIPPQVIIPMSQGFGSSHKPLVAKGDAVYAGQIIGRDDAVISSPVHSSVNGTVIDIIKKNYFKREVTMVIIESGNDESIRPIKGSSQRWNSLSASEIGRILYESGVTALDSGGIPTHHKTSIITPEHVEHLIIHGAGSEPYNISLDMLLKGKNLYYFVDGIRILKKLMPQAQVHCVVNAHKQEIIEKLHKLTADIEYFSLHPVRPKYPQGYDELLVPTVLNKKFPYGYSAANIGIVVLTMQVVMHVFEAVAEGKPLIERIIALCGPSFKENMHVKVRVGTPLKFIVDSLLTMEPSRLILNSPLTGAVINDRTLPVDKTFSQIIAIPEKKEREFLAFGRPGLRKDSYSRSFASWFMKTDKKCSTNMQGEERPCFQCGYCMEVCPVGIIPTLINRYLKVGINETLMKYGIFSCIDCNLCSYVCPSKIPLAKNLKDGKSKLIEVGCDQSMCILPRFDLKGLEQYKGVKNIK